MQDTQKEYNRVMENIPSPEAMYALIYKVCEQFAHKSSNSFEFFEALSVFIREDLKDEGTIGCFTFVEKRLKLFTLEQIKGECRTVISILSKDEEAWRAMVDLELDQLIRTPGSLT
jgi:hypothetical protein